MKSVSILTLVSATILATTGHAVTVATPSGSTSTDPGTGVPWDNVLNVVGTSGSAVYLGDGWILTANHVFDDNPDPLSTSVSFGGVTYDADPTQIYDLTNPVLLSGTASPDLKLVRLTSTLALPSVGIGSSPVGTAVTMIGFSGGKSWGLNEVENAPLSVSSAGRDTASFWTDYDSATTDEGQGATGDSGGGTFYELAGTWYLGGIMLGIGPITDGGQTGTFHADLSFYSTEIESIMSANGSAVPEPAALSLLVLATGTLLRRRR